MILALLGGLAAQDYRFPTSDEDYGEWYPTAYYDHSGVDWACGSFQYSGHGGNDFGAGSFTGMDAGRDIVAAADGSVTATHDGEYDRCTTADCEGGGGYGNYVKVQHDDGKTTIYAHLKQWSVGVSTGARVSCGDKLGEMGSSGYSTGPHLHFEVRSTGNSAVDPFDGDCSSPPSYWVDQGSYGDLPMPLCADPPAACEPVSRLSCGDTVSTSNTASGSQSEHNWYGCEDWIYSGSEISWEFGTSVSETVTVSLTGLSADLDLYALEDAACDGTGCLASSSNGDAESESISFSASAGELYVIVVDGWEGASSNFDLSVSCSGDPIDEGGGEEEPVDTEPPEVEDTTEPEWWDWPDEGEEPGTRTELVRGCGCAGGTLSGSWAPGLLLLALRRRRRGATAPPRGS